MLSLNEMQFEILASEESSEGVGFGIGLDISVDDGGFDPGANEWGVQDTVSPTRGHTQFGRDYLTGPTWAWSLHTNRSDVPEAVESLGVLSTAWRGWEIIDTPGAVLPIRYRLADRVRRVYGRPRRFSAPPSNRIISGLVPITCDFKCVDAFTYDDEESSVSLSANVSQKSTGFTFPVIFPTTTAPPESREGRAFIGGDAPAYPVIRIDGPISKPFLSTDDWRLDLDISLAAGEYAVVDTRPWKLTALKNGTQSVAGKLGRRQWLGDMKLRPGNRSLSFGGSSSTGGATCTVSWRNTHNSI